jgi:hypothetical protein
MASYYQFDQLFRIVFRHDHFADHIFRFFTIELVNDPAGDGTVTPGLAAWCPPDRNSFGYWYDTIIYPFDSATALNGFDDTLHFYFQFRITDPLFYKYTNLQPLPPTMDATKPVNNQVQLNYYFFANHDENLVATNSLLLTKGAMVSAADSMIGQQFYNDNGLATLTDSINVPFGLISIIWNDALWNSNVNVSNDPNNPGQTLKIYKPPDYQVQFPSI